jgi:hypothetical protein
MCYGQLEELILRAIVTYLADKVLERLGYGPVVQTFPLTPETEKRFPRGVPDKVGHGARAQAKRVFSREDALSCQPDGELRLAHRTLLTPFAAEELARRRVRVIRA